MFRHDYKGVDHSVIMLSHIRNLFWAPVLFVFQQEAVASSLDELKPCPVFGHSPTPK